MMQTHDDYIAYQRAYYAKNREELNRKAREKRMRMWQLRAKKEISKHSYKNVQNQ